MNAPLFSSARDWLLNDNGPFGCPGDAHHGLWYQRFYSGFAENDWSVDDSGKRTWIESVVGKVGSEGALNTATDRLVDLIMARGGDFRCFATDWHFVTGLGLPHPVENGFLWHPTLGVPYLPGAAVKGLLRAFQEAWEKPADKGLIGRWFGTESKDDVPERAGDLVFFDALPISQPTLGCDVMTPHMNKWYEKGNDRPLDPNVTPGDWHSPVPVPFLVVEKATLLFGIAPRRQLGATGHVLESDVSDALDLLAQALDWLGAGAKTAAGYGHMRRDQGSEARLRSALDERLKQRRRTKTQQNLSPVERLIEDVLAKPGSNPAVALVQAIENGTFGDPEALRVAAEKAKELMQEDGTWMPDFAGTNKTRVKHRDRSRKVLGILEKNI